jgi:6-phosphogluconolactonase
MVRIFKNSGELSVAAAEAFIQAAARSIRKNGRFTVALTGGSSPAQLYKLLAQPEYRDRVVWEKTYIFWGDERWVPLDDDKSNAKMSQETLLNHVPVPKANVFTMYKDGVSAEEYAAEYEQILKQFFPGDEGFDLILLGMGDDGHTASLFPGTAVLHEEQKWVDAYYLEPQQMYRITLTAPVLNKAQKVILLVFGENKANALSEVLEGMPNIEKYPSQLLKQASGEVIWMVDEAAASKLSHHTPEDI